VNAGTGDHVPGSAVNVWPTHAVPKIVGVGAVVNAATTALVATDKLVAEVNPAFTPVTVTFTNLPRTADVNSYVLPVAPAIGAYVPVAVADDDHT
jgi:hypothetical protein